MNKMGAKYDSWIALEKGLVGNYYACKRFLCRVEDVLGPERPRVVVDVFDVENGSFEQRVQRDFVNFVYLDSIEEDVRPEEIAMFEEAERRYGARDGLKRAFADASWNAEPKSSKGGLARYVPKEKERRYGPGQEGGPRPLREEIRKSIELSGTGNP